MLRTGLARSAVLAAPQRASTLAAGSRLKHTLPKLPYEYNVSVLRQILAQTHVTGTQSCASY